MSRIKTAKIFRKKQSGVKNVIKIIFSSLLLLILTTALFLFINENYLKIDFIPTSADIVHFFGGGGKPYIKPLDNEAAVYFIDVGQGDCEVICTKNYNILIDCGEEEKSDEVIGFLNYSGVKKLDLIIATHPHSDHIGGMYRILQSFDTGTLLIPELPENVIPETVFYEKMISSAKKTNTEIKYARAGTKYVLDESTSLEILAPIYNGYEDLNNISITARFIHGENSFLFTGDTESLAELDILDSGIDISADVLKVAHHGSAGSSSKAFLEKVRPKTAVFEVAEINYYGHPRSEVIERLEDVGCEEFYMTSRDGNIVIVSDGVSLKVTAENDENIAA